MRRFATPREVRAVLGTEHLDDNGDWKYQVNFTRTHSHGGELDDMFRKHLRTLPAGELRNDAILKRWMPTVKERIESLQEQAKKSLNAGREVYREATEIMQLRIKKFFSAGSCGCRPLFYTEIY